MEPQMIYVSLVHISADGIDAEEVELRSFNETACLEWLKDNVWDDGGEHTIALWEDQSHRFIKITSENEGVFVFSHKWM